MRVNIYRVYGSPDAAIGIGQRLRAQGYGVEIVESPDREPSREEIDNAFDDGLVAVICIRYSQPSRFWIEVPNANATLLRSRVVQCAPDVLIGSICQRLKEMLELARI